MPMRYIRLRPKRSERCPASGVVTADSAVAHITAASSRFEPPWYGPVCPVVWEGWYREVSPYPVKKYEGTRLGRQELNAELLDDVPGALWTRALIEAARPPIGFVLPDLVRVVVAIDPAVSSGEDADETGIIVAGKDKDSRGYVLADLSGHHTPIEWARIAVAAYQSHGADRIVAEVNNGGEMVEATLRVVDDNVAYTARHP